MYLHPEMETLTRPEIEKLQLERLQKTVRHCMNSPFYKKRFEDAGLTAILGCGFDPGVSGIYTAYAFTQNPFYHQTRFTRYLSLRNGCRSFGEGSPFAFIQWHNR